MESIDIDSLLKKFKDGQYEEEDLRTLKNCLNRPDMAPKIEQGVDNFGLAVQFVADENNWEQEPPDQAAKDLYKRIEANIDTEKPTITLNKRSFYAWNVAAGLILVIAGIFAYIWYKTTHRIPGTTKLTGIETKRGQKAWFELPDNSKVILNAGSRLIYPKEFGTTREVTLEGEAYFEIAKDSQKLFIVRTGDLETTVLGTSFNINAYPEEQVIKVAVIKGKVQVAVDDGSEKFNKKRQLVGRSLATYHKPEQLIEVETQDNSDLVAWKEGVIHFDNTPFSEVAKTLERWYGVKFFIGNEKIGRCNIYGEFENRSLKSVMNALQEAIDMSYEFDGDVVRVRGKGCEVM